MFWGCVVAVTRTDAAAAEEEDYQIKLNEREATNIGIGSLAVMAVQPTPIRGLQHQQL